MLTSLLEVEMSYKWMFGNQETKYGRLSMDEEARVEKNVIPDSQDDFTQQKRRSSYRYVNIIAVCALGLAVVLFASIYNIQGIPKDVKENHWVSCGNTTEEAIANNCHFDPMLISWVPDACYFKDPSDEYETNEFFWYADKHLKEPLSQAAVHAGNYTTAFTDGSHHDQHCLYTWRKMSIAIEKRLPLLDSKTMDFHHSTHCAKAVRGIVQDALAERTPYKGKYSQVPVNFATCIQLF